MGKEFTAAQRRRIVFHRNQSKTFQIAQAKLMKEGIHVSVSGMKKICKRVNLTRRSTNRQRAGRPRKTNWKEDSHMRRMALNNHETPSQKCH